MYNQSQHTSIPEVCMYKYVCTNIYLYMCVCVYVFMHLRTQYAFHLQCE